MKRFTQNKREIFAALFDWGIETGVCNNKGGQIYRNANLYTSTQGIESKKHPGYLEKFDEYLDKKGLNEDQWQPFFQLPTGEIITSLNPFGNYIVRYDPKTDYVNGIYDKDEFEGEFTEVV